MSYLYETQRPNLFTDDGQRMFLRIRDAAKEHLAKSGAVMGDRLLFGTGDSWDMLACIDRLVELGELLEVPNPFSSAGQHRIYISGRG
jgi:hypothetical protein